MMTVKEYWDELADEGCEELHLWSPQSEWSIVKQKHGLVLLSPGLSLSDCSWDDSANSLDDVLAACDIAACDIAWLLGYEVGP